MNRGSEFITYLQLCFIMMLSTGLLNHVIIIPILLQQAGRDGWLSVIMLMLIVLSWIPLLQRLMKAKGQQALFPWMKETFGPAVAWCVTAVLGLYLWISAFVTVKDTVNWARTSYLPQTPLFVLTVSLLLLCIFGALAGLRSIAVCSGILLPFVLLFGYFIMFANAKYKDYSLMFPLFEHGYMPAVRGTLYIGAGLAELFLLILIQHRISKTPRFWGIAALALILCGLTIGPLIGSITNFGIKEAVNIRYPAFEQWRLVTVSKYIEHVDFLSIYQWMSGAFIRISFMLFLIVELLPLHSLYHRMLMCIFAGVTLLIAVNLHLSDMLFFKALELFVLPGTTAGLTLLSLFLFLMSWFRSRRGTKPRPKDL
ncbi:spore gernimation protein [Paenibacillus dendritiformis]|uniref:GerAB/ArcD/ProY family transporter n=1 Tax=Paenibacillus dendritiformis TaxID=130049 RepID=UPI001F54FE3C|nr:endospore germination permease [Paenibacillus dendritiformis]MBG9792511.1 spore gernimation protein [Paenibacillus dendritiformis]